MIMIEEDWEFNVLNLYNFYRVGYLECYFDFIKKNHDNFAGDIVEAGVFQGKSLISTALLLKKLKSNKKVYGYDTWSGYPPIYHKYDETDYWETLFKKDKISKEHFEKTLRLKKYRQLTEKLTENIDASNISTSGDFINCSKENIMNVLDYFGLDNVILVEGPFEDTMIEKHIGPNKIFAALIDAVLYESYKTCLPFIWNKLEKKGLIYLDEYYSLKSPGGKIATDEFFENKSEKPIKYKNNIGDFERWFVIKQN